MSDSKPVVVIGGGVVGVCSAYYLAEKGREVVLLDKGEMCSGSSYGNAGLVVPSHCVPLASPGALGDGLRWLLDNQSPFYIKPKFDFSLLSWLWQFRSYCSEAHVRKAIPLLRELHRASADLYEDFSTNADMKFGFSRRGMLMLFNSQHKYEDGIQEGRLLAEYGVTFETLDSTQVREMEPAVLPDVTGGVFYPEDAHLNPLEFVLGLAGIAEQKGVHLSPNTEVFSVETSNGKIARLRTTRGDITPSEVVLAGGSWSPGIARGLNLKLPIQPAKGYSIMVKRPPSCPEIPLLLNEAKVAVTPLADTLRFAGTLELGGLDLSINCRRVDAILKGARAFVGGLDELDILEVWRGLRPCTPDGLPIIGRSATYRNLTVAAGHAMVGQSLGPITGKLVSQIVCAEKPEIDIAGLGSERF